MLNRFTRIRLITGIIIIMLQIVVFRHFHLGSYSYCFFYLIILLLYPSKNIVLNTLIGFALGLMVDVAEDTLGMHAAVATFIGFTKPKVLSLLGLSDIKEDELWINTSSMGLIGYFSYISLVTFFHILFFSLLEASQSGLILRVFYQTLLSTVLTLFFMMMAYFLFFNKTLKIKV